MLSNTRYLISAVLPKSTFVSRGSPSFWSSAMRATSSTRFTKDSKRLQALHSFPDFFPLQILPLPASSQPRSTPWPKALCFGVFTNPKCSLRYGRPGDSCAPWAEPYLQLSLPTHALVWGDPLVFQKAWAACSAAVPLLTKMSGTWPHCVSWQRLLYLPAVGLRKSLFPLSAFICPILVWLRKKRIVLGFEAQLLLARH